MTHPITIRQSCRLLATAVLLAALALLTGCICVVKQPVQPAFSGPDLNPLLDQGYVQKTKTFYTILDASQSMERYYNGATKLEIAKEVARRMNLTIPSRLDLAGGLQVFGPGNKADLVYGVGPYDQMGFGSAAMAVSRADGLTPLATGIGRAQRDLADAWGQMALIIITDGEENSGGSALAAGRALKEAYGDRICIYPIMVGDSASGAALLDQLAADSGCGFASNADAVLSDDGMADFVTKVFLKKGMAKAKPAPAPMPMAKPTPPADRDRDGVLDRDDACPNTPLGAPVDRSGCWQIQHVHFDNDKAIIRGEDYPILEEVYRVLRLNPTLRIRVEGYASSPATPAYNLKLSEKRARAVKDYFVNMGIDGDRVIARWYGADRPVASNDTAAGQARNRRVEIHVVR